MCGIICRPQKRALCWTDVIPLNPDKAASSSEVKFLSNPTCQNDAACPSCVTYHRTTRFWTTGLWVFE
jgi:hypothetical protein